MVVLDTSALLAQLFEEPGHESVSAALAESCMSTVNLAEAIGRFVRVGIDEQRARRLILRSTIEFVDFTVERAVSTAKLLPRTSRFGLSLGDRACLALAIERGVPVMTADRAWADLDIGVPVTVIR